MTLSGAHIRLFSRQPDLIDTDYASALRDPPDSQLDEMRRLEETEGFYG